MTDDRDAGDGRPDEERGGGSDRNSERTPDPESDSLDGISFAEAGTEGSDETDEGEDAADSEADGGGSAEGSDETDESDELAHAAVTLGEYDWEEFKQEYFYEDGSPPTNWRGKAHPFEPAEYLGYDPDETPGRVEDAAETAAGLSAYFEDFLDPEATPVTPGEYLWEHFRYEYYYQDTEDGIELPRDEEGAVLAFDRSDWTGHDDVPASVFEGGVAVTDLSLNFEDWLDPATTPVTKGEYFWEHFKYEYYYDNTDVTPPKRPRDAEGDIDRFEKDEWLGFPEEDLESLLSEGAHDARKLRKIEDERTLDVPEALDEDAFFSTVEGHTTLVNRYDLEKAVDLPKKRHFRETDRYWVNKPYSFVVIFHSEKENETKYYLIEPYSTPIESDLTEFLTGKLRSSIKYSSEDVVVEAEDEERAEVIEREALRLLARYDLYAENDGERADQLRELLARYDETKETVATYTSRVREETDAAVTPLRKALEARRQSDASDESRGTELGGESQRDDDADSDADEDPTADAEQTPEAESDAEDETAVADGGAVGGGDDSTDSEVASDSAETPDHPESPETPAEPESPAGTDGSAVESEARTGDGDLSAEPDARTEDGSGDGARFRLDQHLDLDFEAEGSLREQVRAAVEAKIEALEPDESGGLDGISVRPEPVLIEEDDETLSEYQTEKLLYYLKRDFTGYERIDGIKHDINVEDISCDGYNSPVFVYHTDYEQVITNVYHGESELDDFVVKLAQRSGKGISKRQPQVDATLPDGSRAQLTLGREVSDHGTNYTIRQFKDVPFTPIDLVNWNTFSLEEMAFLWLAIENHKSLIFAGGTASGKTTSLNAVSLFIPSNTKIVSIEDTREVELPQRNWIASVTRPSFSDDGKGDVDEFDLLEAALRQRPDYIVMGEIRGEEGRTLFQVMSTGHTTYTTFHADTVGEVLKRFTTEPINVSKTLFTALDLVSIQTQTRVQGSKVRRNKSLTEINEYSAENDEINVQDIFQWRAEDDEFMRLSGSNTMEDIMFDRGWDHERLEDEILKRRVILAYLIKNGLNEYTQVAATAQAFINDPDTILTLVANEQLEESLEDLREMESVHIDIDPKKEEMVPRPDPGEETYELAKGILAEAEDRLLDDYRGADADVDGLAVALAKSNQPTDAPANVETDSDAGPDLGADSAGRSGDGPDRGGPNRETPNRDGPDGTGGPFGGDVLGDETPDGDESGSGGTDSSDREGTDSSGRDRTDSLGDDGDSLGDDEAKRFSDTEEVDPEESVRNPNDAGELGSFPESYDGSDDDEADEPMDEPRRSDDGKGRMGTDDGEGSHGSDDAESHDETDAEGSFGDFEAAFGESEDESRIDESETDEEGTR
jgi:type IV secretory pathway ATPase VirB11/archaellum biosynthesis ATPase